MGWSELAAVGIERRRLEAGSMGLSVGSKWFEKQMDALFQQMCNGVHRSSSKGVF